MLHALRTVVGQQRGSAVLREGVQLLHQSLRPQAIWIVRRNHPGDKFRVVARTGSSSKAEVMLHNDRFGALLQQALRRRRPVMLAHPDASARGRNARARTRADVLIVRIDGTRRPFGAMALRARRTAPFTEAQARLAMEVAEVLSLAVRRFEQDLAVREAAGRYRRLVEGNPDVLYMVSIVPTLRIQYLSPTVLGLTGYSAEEFYADPALITKLIHPDDMPAVRAAIDRADRIRGSMTLRLIGRDGRRTWISASRTVIHGEDGRVIAVQGSVRDINDAVAEREVREAGYEAGAAIVQGRRFEGTLAIILRRLRYVLDADEALVLSDNGPGRFRTISRVGAKEEPQQVATERYVLFQRAVRAGQPVIQGGNVATAIPWSSDRVGVLMVRGILGDALFVGQARAPLERFAREIASAVELMRSNQAQIQRAIDDDRSRIARELHDGVVQTLFAASLQLAMQTDALGDPVKASVHMANTAVREAIQDIQQYVFDLEPSLLTHGGLGPSLRQLAVDFESTSGVKIAINNSPEAISALESVGTHILQIVREALSNVRRHAHAQHVVLTIRQIPSGTLLEIRDDGQGFSPEAAQGLGLRNLRTRARLIKGKLELRSKSGEGSVVRLTVPASSTPIEAAADQLPA